MHIEKNMGGSTMSLSHQEDEEKEEGNFLVVQPSQKWVDQNVPAN